LILRHDAGILTKGNHDVEDNVDGQGEDDVLRPPRFDDDWNMSVAVGEFAGLPVRVQIALRALSESVADLREEPPVFDTTHCAAVQMCNRFANARWRDLPKGLRCDKHVCNGHASCSVNWEAKST
jgi:hypothetical protein